MMACDSPDHLCQELVVDCGYTRVIATRVGALGSSIVRATKPGDFIRAKREKPPCDVNSYIPRFPSGMLREFTLEELEKATANFSCERVIGRGGFGKVFKGILSDGEVVAVKVLQRCQQSGLEQFHAEMRASCAIMGIYHHNLVPAIGYHSSRKRKMDEAMLVYPFMANRDVHRYLGDRRTSSLTSLDWPTRKRIALQVARGICILHQLRIVHRDIKLANVMLNENLDAYVGDFGLAKSIGLPRNSYDVAGLHGDLDSRHSDVTQMVTGKPPIDESEEHGVDGNLLPQAEDFASEESNKEYRAGNVRHQLHGYLPGVSLCSPVTQAVAYQAQSLPALPIRDLWKIDTWTEIVEVDQNERGNSKQLSLQANQHEVATKLREVQDHMREMELKHQAAMEEMHQKQIAIMQSMIKMQGEYIQKVNEIQSQMDQLKGAKKP